MKKILITLISVWGIALIIKTIIDISTGNKNSSNEVVAEVKEEIGSDLNWYAEESITHVCKQNDGPGKMIQTMDVVGYPHNEVDEKKIGDTVVQVTLEMPAQNVSVTYYRGKERCETALNNEKDSKKAVADKYN